MSTAPPPPSPPQNFGISLILLPHLTPNLNLKIFCLGGQDTSELQLNGQKTQQTHKRNETNEVCAATGTLHKHVAPVERKEGRPADWSIWQSKGAVLSRLTWHFLQRWRQPVHLPEEPEEAEGKDKTEGIRGNKRESLGVDKVLWQNKVKKRKQKKRKKFIWLSRTIGEKRTSCWMTHYVKYDGSLRSKLIHDKWNDKQVSNKL